MVLPVREDMQQDLAIVRKGGFGRRREPASLTLSDLQIKC